MKTFYVKDIQDPDSILEAFQEALDTVITKDNVRRILTDKFNTHAHQHVCWHPGKSPLGCVTMLTSDPRKTIAVFVTIFQKSADTAPLPDGFIERAFLQLKGIKLHTSFSYDRADGGYRADATMPSEWFRNAPRLQILLKK